MMHNVGGLYDLLNGQLGEINRQMVAIKEDAQKKIDALPYPENVTVYQLHDGNYNYLLTDLIAAKAQVLSAMAALKAADMQQKGKGRAW